MKPKANQRQAVRCQPPMTPMIDIIFNLLVFFILMPMPWGREGFLTTNLPRQGPGKPPGGDPLFVRVRLEESGPRGEEAIIIFNGKKALGSDFDALAGALAGLRASGLAPDFPVLIAPTPAVQHRWVVRAFDSAVAGGFERIHFAVPHAGAAVPGPGG
jgi:biopolymer transport protein ExbD